MGSIVPPTPRAMPRQGTAVQYSSQQTTARQSVSNANTNDNDLFLYCCVCFQPLSSPPCNGGGSYGDDNDSLAPFWMTSCGHITCSAHIFPDNIPANAVRSKHNCPYCSSTGVSITRLGIGETPNYLQDYFRPTNELLKDFYGAITFQFHNLQRAARHFKNQAQLYREKTEKHRAVLERVRNELAMTAALKKENEALKEELEKVRTRLRRYESNMSPGARSAINTPREPIHTRPSSPISHVPQKRKIPYEEINAPENPEELERRFREEINARRAMPPPMPHRRDDIGIQPVYTRDSQGQLTRSFSVVQNGDVLHNENYGKPEIRRINTSYEVHNQQPQSSHSIYGPPHLFSNSKLERQYPLPQTPSRVSFSRGAGAAFQPPLFIRTPAPISTERVFPHPQVQGRGGSMRLSSVDTSYQGHRSSSPLGRLSLPPKAAIRNPPRNRPKGYTFNDETHSSPFFRHQVSSGGSSHTIRGSVSSRNGVNEPNGGQVKFPHNQCSNFPGISRDSEGFFHRGNPRSNSNHTLMQEP